MIVAWFSAGVTSAVACKMAIEKYPDCRVVFIETGSHEPDSIRFLCDCEKWLGKKIEVIRSKYFLDHFDVIAKTRFINGPHGAACTTKLKRQIRIAFEYEAERMGDAVSKSVYGFDADEPKRAERFLAANPAAEAPLVANGITKAMAFDIFLKAGIQLPKMYQLGYGHNNCVGCVKGGMGYWNKIRKDFPDVFKRMAELERKVGATCLKKDGERLYLDELDPAAGRAERVSFSCGPDCVMESHHDLMDMRRISIGIEVNK